MLKDVRFRRPNPGMSIILGMIGSGRGSLMPERLQEGIYSAGHWNTKDMADVGLGKRIDDYTDFDDERFGCYGVCDSAEQLMEDYGHLLNDPERTFFVTMVQIRRDDEPREGGWRWHKWGEYVGRQDPMMEYIHDEPDIEEVWTYHVYEVLGPGQKTRWERLDEEIAEIRRKNLEEAAKKDKRKPCGQCMACHNNEPCLDPT